MFIPWIIIVIAILYLLSSGREVSDADIKDYEKRLDEEEFDRYIY